MKNLIFLFFAFFLSFTSYAIVGPIAGPSAICMGNSATLTDTTTGGVWSSSDPAIASVDSTGIVNGVAAGMVTITYAADTDFVTTMVTVSPLPTAYIVTGGGHFCEGGPGVPIGLSGSGSGISYQLWNGGAMVSSPVAGTGGAINFGNQVIAGPYTVIGSATATGCSRIMAGVTVITVDPVATIVGPDALCVGSTIPLVTGYGGGAWSSSSPSVASVGPYTGIVSGISAGIATITFVMPTGCHTTKSVIVNSTSPPITGATSMCTGLSGYLYDGAPGGVWGSGNSAIAVVGAFSGLVTGVSPGAVAISYAYGSSCSVSIIINIISAPPPIIGPSTVCVGNTIHIASSGLGGAWSAGNPLIATFDYATGGVTGVSPGTFTVTYSGGTGCNSSKTITVNPPICSGTPVSGTATASASAVCINSPVTITLSGASAGCGIDFQWQSSPDGATFTDISAATDTVYQYNAIATSYYRCRVTCSNTGLFSYSGTIPVSVYNNIVSHSILNVADTFCSIPDFYISSCGSSSASNVTTSFGDGTSVNLPVTLTGDFHSDFLHAYSAPGTYAIKQVLYTGTIPQDSISFTYEFAYCRNLPVKFYFDANNNCVFDSSEQLLALPVTTEIDSNGIAVDTISATSGFYYKAYGAAGTVYSFHVIYAPAGLYVTCPAGGVLYDTIQPSFSYINQKYFGLNCSGTAFDLAEHVATMTGRHSQRGVITIDNTSCSPDDVTVTLYFSPKFLFTSSLPPPVSTIGHTVTWHLTGVNSTYLPQISYQLDVPYYPPLLISGVDTVNSIYTITGTLTGDADTANNVIIKTDTVRSSYDPNEISVAPAGYVLPCTSLQYTIRFENTGNDTARNIYIMDTLSDNLDSHSLQVEIASAAMNVAIINDGLHTIAKFDLPDINLLDSSHHNLADGMVVFNIKTKMGLADGTVILNHAGVFFDDNPAALTDTVQNMIGISPIAGSDNVCAAASDTLSNANGSGIWSSSNAHASVSSGIVNGLTAGTDTISYTVANTCASRSAVKVITINPLPDAGTVVGANHVCVGSSVNLADSLLTGIWSSGDATIANVSSEGVINGISAGAATISYAISNICGTATVTKPVTVDPLPAAITGSAVKCVGATSTLVDITSGGMWSSGSPAIASVGSGTGIVTGMAAGSAFLTYTLPTGCYSSRPVTIQPLPAVYHVTGGGDYCAGGAGVNVGLNGSVAGTTYLLYNATTLIGAIAGTGAPVDFGLVTLAGAYTVRAIYTDSSCQINIPDSAIVNIDPHIVPAVSIIRSPADTLCAGTPASLTPVTVNGGPAPFYQWRVNGMVAATGSTYSYAPANADEVKVTLTSNAMCAAPDTASAAITMNMTTPLTPAVFITANSGNTVAPGQPVTFTAAVTGGSYPPTYQWVVSGTYIAGATNATYTGDTFIDKDSVACIVTTGNLCGDVIVTKTVGIRVSATGTSPLFVTGAPRVWPNPVNNELHIDNGAGCEVRIYNLIGQQVLVLDALAGNREIVDIKPLIPGIYMVHITAANGAGENVKVVKE